MFSHILGSLSTDLAVALLHRFIEAQEYERRIRMLPNYEQTEVNCHVLARVIAPFIGARVASGLFVTLMESVSMSGTLAFCDNEHSWIQLRGGWILDLKPIGIMSDGPILMLGTSKYPGFWHYQAQPIREAPKAARSQKTWQIVRRLRKELANEMLAHPFTKKQRLERFALLTDRTS